tara:strand:+ start:854 stop:1099 length:246 start_codon:yes stop_codon:yes gene_type:complete
MRVHIYKVTPTDAEWNEIGATPIYVHTVVSDNAGARVAESYVITRGWATHCATEYQGKGRYINEDMPVNADGTMKVVVGYH